MEKQSRISFSDLFEWRKKREKRERSGRKTEKREREVEEKKRKERINMIVYHANSLEETIEIHIHMYCKGIYQERREEGTYQEQKELVIG